MIEKGRRPLVVYGIMHLQRRNLFSNYELVEDPNVHTLVQQLEREGDARVFTVWPTAGVDLPELQPDVASWRAPSLALVRGTVLGAADFTAFYPAEVPRRVTIRDGRIVPIPREQWRSLSAEEQFDAVLYLGPPSGMTRSLLSPALCRDPALHGHAPGTPVARGDAAQPGAAATVLRPRRALTTRTGRTPRRIRRRPSPRGLFYRRPPVRGFTGGHPSAAGGAASAAADLAARPGRPRAGALRRRWSCAAVAGAPWQPRRPPPAGATTPAIASRSLLFEQIPSVFEQVASAALVTSSPGRGARQLARRRPCFPELQVELSGARRVAVAAAAVGEGSGGNRRRDSACVPRCATTSRCRRPRTPGVVGDSDEDGATLVSG